MAEYIERGAALTAQNKSMNLNEMRERLNRIPAADVAPVRHGRWIESENGPLQKCSVCGATGWDGFYYCTNCGAKMDAEAKE